MPKLIAILPTLVALVFVGSVVSLGFIISKLDPDAAAANVAYFYIASFATIFSMTFLAGFFIRRAFGVRELILSHIQVSARQALWFGLIVVASLLMLAAGLFTVLNAVFLVLAITFLESYFLYK